MTRQAEARSKAQSFNVPARVVGVGAQAGGVAGDGGGVGHRGERGANRAGRDLEGWQLGRKMWTASSTSARSGSKRPKVSIDERVQKRFPQVRGPFPAEERAIRRSLDSSS